MTDPFDNDLLGAPVHPHEDVGADPLSLGDSPSYGLHPVDWPHAAVSDSLLGVEHAGLPQQMTIHTDKGDSSVVAMGVEADGSVLAMGVGHGLGATEAGGILKASVVGADGNPLQSFEMEVVFIHGQHDRFFARIDPATVEGWRQNFGTDLTAHLRANVKAGDEVWVEQEAGVYMPVLRHGIVGGSGDKEGGLLTLTGTEATLGSSGAPVFDRSGHLVGQVVAYDPKNHVNLMSSAEQILDDLRDFRNGVNMVERAHPVNYAGAVAPVVKRAR